MRTPLLSVFALSMGLSPALAQVTAEDLLTEWQTLFAQADQALEFADRQDTGSGVVLTELRTALPVQDGKIRVTAPRVTLTDQGDGTVRIDVPDPVLVVIETDDQTIAGRIIHDGLDLVAGGTAQARSYSYAAARAEGVIDAATDEDGRPVPLEMSFVGEAVQAEYLATMDLLTTDYTMQALQVDVSGQSDDASEPGRFAFAYRMTGVTGESEGPSGALLQTADPARLLRDGGRTTSTLTHTGAGYTVEADGPEGSVLVDSSSASGALGFALGPEGLAYDLASRAVKVRVAGDVVPFPVELAFDGFGLDLRTPILAQPDPQPFGLRLTLDGLTGSQSLWSMFDPSEVLPRTPGQVTIDISGTQLVTRDLTADPEDDFAMPTEVTSVDLNTLLVALLGAQLTGEGAFTLNPSAPGFVPGMPAGVGSASFKLLGANKLIDQLVQIGILRPEDTMGLRMMMGFAARPGPEPDSLVSTIELTPDGGVIANGMQLR